MPVTEIEEVLELQAGVVSTGGELHFRGGRAQRSCLHYRWCSGYQCI